jgi:nucleotide-binding universal stress UspA family protein
LSTWQNEAINTQEPDMFERIMVALDGSAASNAALKAAVQLARDQHAKLQGLYVVDDMAVALNFASRYGAGGFTDALHESLHQLGGDVLDQARKAAEASGVTIECLLAEARGESVARAILEEANRSKADLLVLGTHGRRGLARMVMGSDAEAVVRQATVPVMLVRKEQRSVGARRARAKRSPGAKRSATATGGGARTPAAD